MDNAIKLKSRVKLVHNHRNIDISAYVPEFTPEEEKIKKDIERYRIKYGQKAEADEIALGDMVTLSCKSDNAKFNKDNIVVPVGKGLFSKALEENIIGLGINEEKTVNVDGDAVIVTATKISRTIPAEISADDMAEIRHQCINKQLDMLFDEGEEVDGASAYICTVVAEKSEFDLDENEINQVISDVKQKVGDNDEMLEIMKTIFINTFKNAVIGYCYAEKNNAIISMEEYEKFIDGILEYNPDITRDKVKKNHPIFDFAQTRYADYYIKMIDEYIKNEFKKVLNK